MRTIVFIFIIFLGLSILSADTAHDIKTIIPVYLSDNHGESFYFFAERLDWNKKYTLLIFDMHSDSRSVIDSDFIRDTLRSNHLGDQSLTNNEWRHNGVIQCYNWIEPLIPHPVNNIIWVPSKALDKKRKEERYKEIEKLVNADIEFSDRRIKDLSKIFTILSFDELKKYNFPNSPMICSIDLDYFTGTPESQASDDMAGIFEFISGKNLHALTVSVSRPYLSSDDEADNLLYNSLWHIFLIINSDIWIDFFRNTEYDRSDLALKLLKQGKEIRYYNLNNASSLLKSLLLRNNHRFKNSSNNLEMAELISSWERSEKQFNLQVKANMQKRKSGRVGAYDFISGEKYAISIPCVKNGSEISWYTYTPLFSSYNISPSNLFAKDDPSVIYYKPIRINSFSNRLSINSEDLFPFFNSSNNCGTVRLSCIVTEGNKKYISETITVTHRENNSYTGYLTEQMNLPYIFGGTLLRYNDLYCADLLFGSECSTFLIYGKRASGKNINYGDPNRLLAQTKQLYDMLDFKEGIAYCNGIPVSISPENINNGLILYFGLHVAALYADNEPYKILDDNDMVIHQLEGYPEIVALAKLREKREIRYILTFK